MNIRKLFKGIIGNNDNKILNDNEVSGNECLANKTESGNLILSFNQIDSLQYRSAMPVLSDFLFENKIDGDYSLTFMLRCIAENILNRHICESIKNETKGGFIDSIKIEFDGKNKNNFICFHTDISKEDLIKKIPSDSGKDALLFIFGYNSEIKVQDIFTNFLNVSLHESFNASKVYFFSSPFVDNQMKQLIKESGFFESGFIHPDLIIKKLNNKIDNRVYYENIPISTMSAEQQYQISQKVFEYAIKRGFNMEYREIKSYKYLLFETVNSPMSMNRLMEYKFESGMTHNLPFYLSNEVVYGCDNQYENINEERREMLRDVIYNKMHNVLHNLDKEIEGNVPIYSAFIESTYLANYKFSVPNYKTNDIPKNTWREAPNKIRYRWKAITPLESVNNILEQVEGNRLLTAKEIEDVAMLISTHHEVQEQARNHIRETAFKNELEEHGLRVDDNVWILTKEPHEVYERLLKSIDNKLS